MAENDDINIEIVRETMEAAKKQKEAKRKFEIEEAERKARENEMLRQESCYKSYKSKIIDMIHSRSSEGFNFVQLILTEKKYSNELIREFNLPYIQKLRDFFTEKGFKIQIIAKEESQKISTEGWVGMWGDDNFNDDRDSYKTEIFYRIQAQVEW